MNVTPQSIGSKRERSPDRTVPSPMLPPSTAHRFYAPQHATAGIGATQSTTNLEGLTARSAAKVAGTTPREDTRNIFEETEKNQLKVAEKVVIFEYSSTGGGHTARGLEPLVAAVDAEFLNAGDVVCIFAPPAWPHDKGDSPKAIAEGKGNAKKTLEKYIEQLQNKGVKVLVKQTDKTITGLYIMDGDKKGQADKESMLLDFVNKARRPVGNSATAKSICSGKDVPAFQAKNIIKQAIDICNNNTDKFVLVGDMAPYAQKAASKLGITNRVEIGNHQGMFSAQGSNPELNNAFLYKAAGNSYVKTLALVDYDKNMNTLVGLNNTVQSAEFQKLGIEPTTTKENARRSVFKFLIENANRIDPKSIDEKAPKEGVICHQDLTAETAKAAVYLYVNEYTDAVAQHIKNKINGGDADYKNTLFVVCGSNAWRQPLAKSESAASSQASSSQAAPEKSSLNIMHLMLVANADGVTSGGFGTTSEFNYAKANDYQGNFIVAPVERQDEQQKNAVDLKSKNEDSVFIAQGIEDVGDVKGLKSQMDAMVRTKKVALEGNMESLLKAAKSATTHAGHAATLIVDPKKITQVAIDILGNMAEADKDAQFKQVRRLLKLQVSVVQALIKDGPILVSPTAKVEPKLIDLEAAIKALETKELASELLEVEMKGGMQEIIRKEFADKLEHIRTLEVGLRKQAAETEMTRLANRFFLGW